ncbi:hypothetical protein [Nonlabens spongiae]|uniref:hypothetical protein n=1 Tax=Nonlabens spongiae TaxID=331648 RepID=UPI0012F5090E|nr:hypothetical protein [Nonlabens spongiae]
MLQKLTKYLFLLAVICSMHSCHLFENKEEVPGALELDGYYLLKSDILQLLPENYTKEDSLRIVDSYVKNWMLNTALYENALNNIPEERQEQIDELVDRYKIELYTQEYLKELTIQNLDTSISKASIKQYYSDKSEEFRLNEDLMQLIYVKVDPVYGDLSDLKKMLSKRDSISRVQLDSLKLAFKDYILNDSLWLKKSTVFEKIDPINASNEQDYIVRKKFSQFKDSTGIYMMYVSDVLERGAIAPLSFIEPSIRQIILNRKKLEFKKELEKDLLQDAKVRVKNRLYE